VPGVLCKEKSYCSNQSTIISECFLVELICVVLVAYGTCLALQELNPIY
jgi:hypothetical protein